MSARGVEWIDEVQWAGSRVGWRGIEVYAGVRDRVVGSGRGEFVLEEPATAAGFRGRAHGVKEGVQSSGVTGCEGPVVLRAIGAWRFEASHYPRHPDVGEQAEPDFDPSGTGELFRSQWR